MKLYTSLAAICLATLSSQAQSSATTVNLRPAGKAPHIIRIVPDTVVVAQGSTYSFTVDTPENEGLVTTNPGVAGLLNEIAPADGRAQQYQVVSSNGTKKQGMLVTGDRLEVSTAGGQRRSYYIRMQEAALAGVLKLDRTTMTLQGTHALTLFYTAGQRSPMATIRIVVPAGIAVSMEQTTVNVIGRGKVALKDLNTQSIGRVGSRYSYSKVGDVQHVRQPDGSTLLIFSQLDLRPANGPDLQLVFNGVRLTKAGSYRFSASYQTSSPAVLQSAGTAQESAVLKTSAQVSDLARCPDQAVSYQAASHAFSLPKLTWTPLPGNTSLQLLQSANGGRSWQKARATIDTREGIASIAGLATDRLYWFRLQVLNGVHKGLSNVATIHTGMADVQQFGVSGTDGTDQTIPINAAIDSLHRLGGGVLRFSKGTYCVRTIYLKSNVWLYIDKEATLKALKGADAPESTWFSDRQYRSGLSPTDAGPYADPENYLTKQDVGHHYFRNAMFFAEREDNIRIVGNGRITGDGNLVTSDKVMNNTPDNRADKMFVFKLCTRIEIGGLERSDDLWYDAAKDEPYYIRPDGSRDANIDNMVQIDRAGHFVLLATGTDGIYVHNTYFSRAHSGNARDIYDFMGCNDVKAVNIYSKVSSDDIIKPGSDCSLGFTRPAKGYTVRNVIGDTNCNLFQIGSETADDIQDVHVDNIYVLGANKAGFSISTNDGGHIRDVHLNCGHTGPIHSRSVMQRATTPFFISISNRGRILGATVGQYSFTENGVPHQELLVKNVNIGRVENILLNGVDVSEVYSGSSFNGQRWRAWDGSQKTASPIVAGYQLPDAAHVAGDLDFTLPNGQHTGYIDHVVFNDIRVLVKGGRGSADTLQQPPELGVGQYNVSNLKVQPSFGLWARHARSLILNNCSFHYEQPDGRYAIYLDDVQGARITNIRMMRGKDNPSLIKWKGSKDVSVVDAVYYPAAWGKDPVSVPSAHYASGNSEASVTVSGTP